MTCRAPRVWVQPVSIRADEIITEGEFIELRGSP